MIFLQREGQSGTLSFHGDAARVLKDGAVVVDWTSGGVISDIPQGSGYTVEIQRDGAVTTDDLEVGVIVFALGQSNMVGWFDTPTDYASDPHNLFLRDGAWQPLEGAGASAFADELSRQLGAPVAFVSGAVGGTALLERNSNQLGYWLEEGAGTLYQNAIDQLALVGGKAEFTLWIQGENDASHPSTTAQGYATGLSTLFAKLQSAFSPHILVGELGPADPSVSGLAEAYAQVRLAQELTASRMSDVYAVPTPLDVGLRDTVHLSGASSALQALGLATKALSVLGIDSGYGFKDGTDAGDSIAGTAGRDWISAGSGDDTAEGGLDADVLQGGPGNDSLTGGEGADLVLGGTNEDAVDGGSGDDVLSGGDGRDSLSGGSGTDELWGDPGDDTLEGGDDSDLLFGGEGKDTLDGGAAADSMEGGNGDDLYLVDSSEDVVSENGGSGIDVVRSSATFVLPGSVETLVLIGAGLINGTGNDLGNTITGGDGGNVLNGLGGNDTLSGGIGDDTYLVETAGDVVEEQAGAGTDLVIAPFASTLGANVENLMLAGTAVAGTGNGLANVITGNAVGNSLKGLEGNDTLDGGAGVDTLIGGTGDDTYVIDKAGEAREVEGEGTDTIQVQFSSTIGTAFENLVLAGNGSINGTGNAAANFIAGNGGNNVLIGLGGADTLDGGGGIDTVSYASSAAGVGCSLETGEGSGGDGAGDRLRAVENLTGSALGDTLEGSAGNNVLAGGSGIDTASYEHAAAAVAVNLGIASAQSTGGAGFDKLSGFENLTGSGFADTLTGASGGNVLAGLAGDDFLNGAAGADTMIGGSGNDTYRLDNVGDVVDETGGDGNDTVLSAKTFSLADAAHVRGAVENLTLTDSASINGTGNGLDGAILGNSGSNILAGLGGADTLDGAGGVDTATYAASPLGVAVSLETGEGTGGDAQGDSLSGIENLIGSALDDTLEGSGGGNVLVGGSGIDTVSYEHAAASIAVGLASTGVQNTIGAGSDKVSGFENLTGSAFDDKLTGASGANILTGLDGNDTITGGAGADTMSGGTGSDTFVFATTGFGKDTITDFESGPAAGDAISIAHTVFASLAALLAHTAENAAGDAVIALNATNSIVLQHVHVADLSANDFLFV